MSSHYTNTVSVNERKVFHRVGWRRGLLRAGLVLGMVVSLSFASLSTGLGWVIDPAILKTFQDGIVTAQLGTEIRINNKDYALHSQVAVRDQEDRPKSLKDLARGTEVKFHFKTGKIDEIIIMLPE